jgi:ribokinase
LKVERADLIVVNTHGGDGASLYRSGELVAVLAALPASVRNTVAAGDAFCAALICGLAAGIAPQAALEPAAAVGAAAVEDDRSQPLLGRWKL